MTHSLKPLLRRSLTSFTTWPLTCRLAGSPRSVCHSRQGPRPPRRSSLRGPGFVLLSVLGKLSSTAGLTSFRVRAGGRPCEMPPKPAYRQWAALWPNTHHDQPASAEPICIELRVSNSTLRALQEALCAQRPATQRDRLSPLLDLGTQWMHLFMAQCATAEQGNPPCLQDFIRTLPWSAGL